MTAANAPTFAIETFEISLPSLSLCLSMDVEHSITIWRVTLKLGFLEN